MTEFRIDNFREVTKGTLVGFCTVRMPSGMIINNVTIRRNGNGFWVTPPSKPRMGANNEPLKDENGKPVYEPLVDFDSRKLRDRWSEQVMAALREQYPAAVRDQ